MSKLYFPNGDSYTGETECGYRHGFGRLMSSSGSLIYAGDWNSGVRHGQGIESSSSTSSFYSGTFSHGNRHGSGCMQWRTQTGDRITYSGNWEKGRMSGSGTCNWLDSSQLKIYQGDWVDSEPHGMGLMTWIPLSSLSESDRNNIKSRTICGMDEERVTRDTDPVLKIPEVSELSSVPVLNYYCGDFIKGKRHGNGVFFYADGSQYQGQWAEDRREGKGSFTDFNGCTRSGTWHDGEELGVNPETVQSVEIVDVSDLFADSEGIKEATSSLMKSLPSFRQAFAHYRSCYPQLYTFCSHSDLAPALDYLVSLSTIPLVALWQLLQDCDLLTDCSLTQISRSIKCEPSTEPIDPFDHGRRVSFRNFLRAFVYAVNANGKRVGDVEIRAVLERKVDATDDSLISSHLSLINHLLSDATSRSILLSNWSRIAGTIPETEFQKYKPLARVANFLKSPIRLDGTVQVVANMRAVADWLSAQGSLSKKECTVVGEKNDKSRITSLDEIHVKKVDLENESPPRALTELDWSNCLSLQELLGFITEYNRCPNSRVMDREICFFEFVRLIVRLIEHRVMAEGEDKVTGELLQIILPELLRSDRWLDSKT